MHLARRKGVMSDVYDLPLANGAHVSVASRSFGADWGVFSEVFQTTMYEGDFAEAYVIDIGAHKGYFGAFALLRGATALHSYEPAADNYALLQRAAESFRATGRHWATSKQAVGPRAGTATLEIKEPSWGHRMNASIGSMGTTEEVDVIELGDVVSHLPAERVIVKMDVEGLERAIIMTSPATVWNRVDELFLKIYGPKIDEDEPITRAEVLLRLQEHGLEICALRPGNVLRFKRYTR